MKAPTTVPRPPVRAVPPITQAPIGVQDVVDAEVARVEASRT